MSRRHSPQRLGLLRLIADREAVWEGEDGEFPGAYLPGISDIVLSDYGLTVWDNATITFAAKAGLIEQDSSRSFAKLTAAGRAVLDAPRDSDRHAKRRDASSVARAVGCQSGLSDSEGIAQ
jgi:hypothetical protein